MTDAIWGFVGALLGGSVSIITTLITNRNAAGIQSKASQAARAEQQRIFQHDTLAALQESLDDLLQEAIEAGTNTKEHKTLDKVLGLLGAGYTQTQRTVQRLVMRVADDALRKELGSTLETAMMAIGTDEADEADRLCNELLGSVYQAQVKIGTALRARY